LVFKNGGQIMTDKKHTDVVLADSLEAQYLRKLNQAENILNAIEELLKKEYRGQPEMALVKQLIAEYRLEWS